MEQWTEDLPTIEWERRTKDKLLWRGSNTGAFYSEEIDWRRTHRVRLVEFARGGDEMVDVIPPPRWGRTDDDQEREDDEDDDDDLMAHKRRKTIKQAMRVLTKDAIERKMLDIAFAGEPIRESSPSSRAGVLACSRGVVAVNRQNVKRRTGRASSCRKSTSGPNKR